MKSKKPYKINLVTLGCAKNIVDSEFLSKKLSGENVVIGHNLQKNDADLVIINTCGFINDAKEESIETILGYVKEKEKGNIRELFVMGCLAERFKNELQKEIPEVDAYFGVNSFDEILRSVFSKKSSRITNRLTTNYLPYERILSTPKHYAYLKISEGCNRICSFCAIPLIRGKQVSKTIEELSDETKFLVSQGVKEINIIAQDTTSYGIDIYGENRLVELLDKLSQIDGVGWLRLHYAYPIDIPIDLLKLMNERSNICKYLDIPFQHINDNLLKRMRRGHSKKSTYGLIEKIRREVPDIALRTTLMVGFPGETDKEFRELMEFVKEVRFDRLGAFIYSHEEGTWSFENFNDDIPFEIKGGRLSELMKEQQIISEELNNKKIGRVLKTLVESTESEFYVGRSEFDSPEIDTEVLIERHNHQLNIGEFYEVEITDTDMFDVYGILK